MCAPSPPPPSTVYRGGEGGGGGEELGNAQVPNLDGLLPRAVVLVEKDVGGLDVPFLLPIQ